MGFITMVPGYNPSCTSNQPPSGSLQRIREPMRLEEQLERQRPVETRLTGTDHRATENCIAAELMNLCAEGGKTYMVMVIVTITITNHNHTMNLCVFCGGHGDAA